MGGGLPDIRAARAAGDMGFWATGTLDIGDGWSRVADDLGLNVTFSDNGNDPGPVVARLVTLRFRFRSLVERRVVPDLVVTFGGQGRIMHPGRIREFVVP